MSRTIKILCINILFSCDGEETPGPEADPEADPNNPEEPDDGSCGSVSHNAGSGGSWVCEEEDGIQVCHHTCEGGIKVSFYFIYFLFIFFFF